MHDDSNPNFDDITRDTSDPNAETHHEDKASGSWLDTNVGVRADEWIGRRIGEFEIIRIIGMGGMGNVYEAKQIHPHRSVALKIVKSAAATPATLHRFEMESELLARLQHPGIAQVYDSGHQIQDDVLLPYFAMEYIPGSRSITDYSEEEHLSREGRLALFLRVCEAVQYGHGRGVIHRDLKPSNILITSAGRPKVIDFGVALMAGSDEVEKTVTAAGKFVGTLQWSSPEQCGDDPQDVDVRTDVYSLGVLMYQLMTGELPYVLKGIPLYRAPLVIRETKPTLPQSIDPSIPVEIDQILMKALAKERESRYESVADMAMDIRRFLTNQPIHAKPPTTMHRLRLYARRNQLKFRAGIVVFLALLLGLTGLIWGFVESEARQRDMKIALEVEATARNVAEQKAYIAMIGTAQAAIANESWEMARRHLAETKRELRGWEWNYLRGIVDQSLHTWIIGDRLASLATSPTGQYIVLMYEGGRLTLHDEPSAVSRDVMLPSEVKAATFSNDEKLLFLGLSNGDIGVLDLDNESLFIFNQKMPSVESIVALGNDTFATGHSNGLIYTWNSNGEKLSSMKGEGGMVLTLDYDSGRDAIASGTIDGTVVVWKMKDAVPVLRNNGHAGAVRAVLFLEDGRLISGSDDDTLIVWDLSNNTHRKIETNHGGVMDVSSTGDVIATAGLDGVVRLWSLPKVEVIETLRGHEDFIWSIGALKNNRFVSADNDGSVRWWSASPAMTTTHRATSRMPTSDVVFVWNEVLAVVSEFDSDMQVINVEENEHSVIPSNGSELSSVSYVPNTSLVVTGDLSGEVRLWDIEKLEREELVGLCDGQITAISVSPNGHQIAAGTLVGKVCVFHRQSGKMVYETENYDAIVLAIAFNDVGDVLFISTIDGNISAVDLELGEELWNRIGNGNDIVAMEFLQSRNALLTATSSRTLQLLSARNGEVLESRDAKGGLLRDIVVFQDESRFVTALSDGTVGVWDTASFNLIASLPTKQSLECISVSRDGYRLAIGGGSATIEVMDGMSRGARFKNAMSKQSD